jgi:hypothetical protein
LKTADINKDGVIEVNKNLLKVKKGFFSSEFSLMNGVVI